MPNGGHPMHLDIQLEGGDVVLYASGGVTVHVRTSPGADEYRTVELTTEQVDALRQQLDHWCPRPMPVGLARGDGIHWAM